MRCRIAYVWGPRNIDDIVLRMIDSDADGDYDVTYYHLTDAMFSTVATLNGSAVVVERVSYDPYGTARHQPRADMNGDGVVGVPDMNIVISGWGSVPNKGDVNRDGLVGNPDLLAVISEWGANVASGRLSYGFVDNIIGFGPVGNPDLKVGRKAELKKIPNM